MAAVMRLKSVADGVEHEVGTVEHDAGAVRVTINGKKTSAEVRPLSGGGAILTIGGRTHRVFAVRRNQSILVSVGPSSYEFGLESGRRRRAAGGPAAPTLEAPMPGKILLVMVTEGQTVKAGETLVVLEAMKMETTLSAETDAMVKRVLVEEGQMVDHGETLIELGPPPAKSIS